MIQIMKKQKKFLDDKGKDYEAIEIRNPNNGLNSTIPMFQLDENNESKVLSPLYREIEGFEENVNKGLNEIINVAKEIDGNDILDSARSALKTVKDISNQVTDIKDGVLEYIDMAKEPIRYTKFGLTIYYALIIVSLCLGVCGTLLLILCGYKCCRCVSNLGCTIIGFLMVLCFLIVAVLFTVSVVIVEACGMITIDALEGNELLPESFWYEAEICLKGDGDLYRSKDIETHLKFASDSIDGLNFTTEYYNNGRITYLIADGLIKELENIIEKEPYNANPAWFEDKKEGNLFPENCRGDTIVWTTCPEGMTPIDSVDLANNKPSCLSLKKFDSSHSTQISNRYSICSSISDEINEFLIYYDDVRREFARVIEDIKGPSTSYTDDTYYKKMDQDNDDIGVTDVFNKLSGEKGAKEIQNSMETLNTKLRKGLNCKFMEKSYNRVHTSLCDDLNQILMFTSLFMGIISALSIVYIIILICVHRKFNPIKKNSEEKYKERKTSERGLTGTTS